jgi:hypothetical protein
MALYHYSKSAIQTLELHNEWMQPIGHKAGLWLITVLGRLLNIYRSTISMKFRLVYRGELKSNGNPAHKHDIRKVFHRQLLNLWNDYPLNDVRDFINIDPDKGDALGIKRGGIKFVPLISPRLELVASLEILLLRPEAAGSVLTQAGDIDNRLKTLMDALQVPKENQMPKKATEQTEESFLYCLLEDDNLVTSLDISTGKLYDTVSSSNEVLLVISVTADFTHGHFTNRLEPPQLSPR